MTTFVTSFQESSYFLISVRLLKIYFAQNDAFDKGYTACGGPGAFWEDAIQILQCDSEKKG